MKKTINIALDFSGEQYSGLCPVIKSIHVYPLKTGSIGSFSCPGNWALEYHAKDAGFFELRNEPGNWRKRCADSIHLYAPYCYYREDTRKADLPLEENYFIFSGGEECGLERLLHAESLFAILHDSEGSIGSLMRKAGELCESGGQQIFWKIEALFMEIMQLLTSAYQKPDGSWAIGSSDRESDTEFSYMVEQYLRRHIAQNVRTSEIAKYMKISESSLNHRFKAETGKSPIARLIELRIDFAKSLLRKGERLKNIADMTGFYDEYHLSKTFKKQSGISPRGFKNIYS